MKEFLKRAAALLSVALIITSVSVTSFAEPTTRPKPGTTASETVSSTSSSDNNSDTKSSKDDDAEESSKETQKPTAMPVVTEAPSTTVANKSYTTKGGAFLWFLLSVIVNTVISFAIANRFYKLTRRSNQVQSELRALRRDIEDKFADSVGGFVESNVDITNTNDDYSMDEDGIKMTPSSTVNVDDEPGDVYKQWEEQFGARYAARKAQVEEDTIEEITEERPVRKYQPTRKSAQSMSVSERIAARKAQREAEIEEVDEENFEDEGSFTDKLSDIGDKAKKFIGGIFPFDDDED